METYVILRRGGWRTGADLEAAADRSILEGDRMPDDIRWIRSYVLSETDGTVGTVCIYEASSPEAIRRHARAADLPVDEIIAVADTVVVRPDPVTAGNREGGMIMKRSWLAAAVCAATVTSLGANAALAGEVTGSGKKEDQNNGMSWCSFSGLNDRVVGEGPTDTRTQSFGQDVKAGADPRVANPGLFCNPNRTPLPPNPNR